MKASKLIYAKYSIPASLCVVDLPTLLTLACDIAIGLSLCGRTLGQNQRLDPVAAEHLAVPEINGHPGRAFHVEEGIAEHFLAQIDDETDPAAGVHLKNCRLAV